MLSKPSTSSQNARGSVQLKEIALVLQQNCHQWQLAVLAVLFGLFKSNAVLRCAVSYCTTCAQTPCAVYKYELVLHITMCLQLSLAGHNVPFISWTCQYLTMIPHRPDINAGCSSD